MGFIGPFLMSIAGSLAARVMVSLGIGVVSYIGFNTLVTAVNDQVHSAYGSAYGIPLDLLNMAGAGQAIGILTGALVTRVSLMAIKKFRIT